METTDSCLYSWKSERSILEGEQPFEFRLLTGVRSGAKSLLSSDWRKLMESGDGGGVVRG